MTTEKNYFREIEDNAAFSRVGVKLVMHPKKPGKYAKILTAYPKDGAGRLTVYIVDGFADRLTTQKGTAGGYGYDKFVAALSSMTIDGHSLTDHAGQDEISKKLLKAYGKARLAGAAGDKVYQKARKLGYSFTNWSQAGGYQPNKWEGYQSCYREPGLDYLKALGYQVIDVL